MMHTVDDRNKPVDPFNTRKSIDECSGEEWNAASQAYWAKASLEWDATSQAAWAKASIDKQLYEEDPVYSKDPLFDGNLFDVAEESEQRSETYKMIEDEDAFEAIVDIMGPWEAISFCHGTALAILMDKDNFTSSASIEKAKVYLSRMARLINETRECNW